MLAHSAKEGRIIRFSTEFTLGGYLPPLPAVTSLRDFLTRLGKVGGQ